MGKAQQHPPLDILEVANRHTILRDEGANDLKQVAHQLPQVYTASIQKARRLALVRMLPLLVDEIMEIVPRADLEELICKM